MRPSTGSDERLTGTGYGAERSVFYVLPSALLFVKLVPVKKEDSMQRTMSALGVGVVMTVFAWSSAWGQTPAAGEADPGVRPTRLIDRAEVRVTRVELQPGATRRIHTHDDVDYHLWIPVEGRLQLTIGSDAPVAAASGQAFFFKRGTPHGFKNAGQTPAAVLEIFVKPATPAAGRAAIDPLALGLAALRDATAERSQD